MSADDTFGEVEKMYEKFNMDEETPAEFCGDMIRNAQQEGFAKSKIHSAAVAAGLVTDQASNAARLKHGSASVLAISFTYQNYGADALRTGSVNDPTRLLAIIGSGAPSDPEAAHATIAKMASARGRVLTDE